MMKIKNTVWCWFFFLSFISNKNRKKIQWKYLHRQIYVYGGAKLCYCFYMASKPGKKHIIIKLLFLHLSVGGVCVCRLDSCVFVCLFFSFCLSKSNLEKLIQSNVVQVVNMLIVICFCTNENCVCRLTGMWIRFDNKISLWNNKQGPKSNFNMNFQASAKTDKR